MSPRMKSQEVAITAQRAEQTGRGGVSDVDGRMGGTCEGSGGCVAQDEPAGCRSYSGGVWKSPHRFGKFFTVVSSAPGGGGVANSNEHDFKRSKYDRMRLSEARH